MERIVNTTVKTKSQVHCKADRHLLQIKKLIYVLKNIKTSTKSIGFGCHFSSVAQSCPAFCNPMNHSTPDHPVHHQLPEPTKTRVHLVDDHIQSPHPLASPSPPASIFHSIRVFFNESALCIRWPKYWSFSLNISPSNEDRGLISFRMDWLDLLAVQGTLKSLLQQFKSTNSSELSFLYSPTLTSIHDHWKHHSLD